MTFRNWQILTWVIGTCSKMRCIFCKSNSSGELVQLYGRIQSKVLIQSLRNKRWHIQSMSTHLTRYSSFVAACIFTCDRVYSKTLRMIYTCMYKKRNHSKNIQVMYVPSMHRCHTNNRNLRWTILQSLFQGETEGKGAGKYDKNQGLICRYLAIQNFRYIVIINHWRKK